MVETFKEVTRVPVMVMDEDTNEMKESYYLEMDGLGFDKFGNVVNW